MKNAIVGMQPTCVRVPSSVGNNKLGQVDKGNL